MFVFGLLVVAPVLLVPLGTLLLERGYRLLREPDLRARLPVGAKALGPFRSSGAPPLEMEVRAVESLGARVGRYAAAIAFVALGLALIGSPLAFPSAFRFFF
jgi:hypothetical protein